MILDGMTFMPAGTDISMVHSPDVSADSKGSCERPVAACRCSLSSTAPHQMELPLQSMQQQSPQEGSEAFAVLPV